MGERIEYGLTPMNIAFREAVRNIRKRTPAERARLLVLSGAVPPEREAEVAARFAANRKARKAAKRAATGSSPPESPAPAAARSPGPR